MTSKPSKARVLCVDDESEILQGLKLQLRKVAHVELAGSGPAGLEILESSEPFDVVISDMRMPKMNGAAFLSTVRERWPETERILLSGQADMESTIAAVNDGGIRTFLTKPTTKERLISEIEAALETRRLRSMERELIEGTLKGALGILSEVLGIVSPAARARAIRMESIVRQLSVALHLEDAWRFQVAATLSQIGCVSVPEETLDLLREGREVEAREDEAYLRHPGVAFDLITRIPRLEEVAEMVRSQLAPTEADTGASPARWTVEETGAELLRIAGAADTLLAGGENPNEIVKIIAKGGEHPRALVDALPEVDLSAGVDRIKRSVTAAELCEEMTLIGDLRSTSGVMLATGGTEITQVMLTRIRNFAANTGLEEPIEVWAECEPEPGGEPES